VIATGAVAAIGGPVQAQPAPLLSSADGGSGTPPAADARSAAKFDPTFGEQGSGGGGNSGGSGGSAGAPDTEPADRERGGRSGAVKAPKVRTVSPGKAFFGTKHKTKFRFDMDFHDRRFFDDHKVVAKVDLRRKRHPEEIRTWRVPVEDADEHAVRWDGTRKGGGKPPSPGKYAFDVTPVVDGKPVKAKKAAGSDASDSATFDFYTHIFPIDAHHDYGDKGARFGAGRKGHTHQGQDIFAKCGSPLRAARAGEVQANQYQSSAGFYIVIDGEGTDVDYVYMHMKKRSDFHEGDKVHTGEAIGQVGDTGDAHGCHLHFELWSGPGWFEGGKPYDPLPQLKGWDKFS
jgi:murein DD-endopeptidase MepM/ murein hydrolase activator NlpD